MFEGKELSSTVLSQWRVGRFGVVHAFCVAAVVIVMKQTCHGH